MIHLDYRPNLKAVGIDSFTVIMSKLLLVTLVFLIVLNLTNSKSILMDEEAFSSTTTRAVIVPKFLNGAL
jgi:hypothetical protein